MFFPFAVKETDINPPNVELTPVGAPSVFKCSVIKNIRMKREDL